MNQPNYMDVLEAIDRDSAADAGRQTSDGQLTRSFRLTRVADLLKEPEPLRWLIWDYLLPGSLCLLFGEPAAGKSLLALAWAACVATGLDWCGHRVSQGPIVYIAGEGHFGIRRRLKAWGLPTGQGEKLDCAPLFVSDTGASLIENESLLEVAEAVDEVVAKDGSPALIVIDTLHRNFGPGDENSARDVGKFVQVADLLRAAYGATVLIVHHSGHGSNDRARGSSALRAAVDTEFMLEVR